MNSLLPRSSHSGEKEKSRSVNKQWCKCQKGWQPASCCRPPPPVPRGPGSLGGRVAPSAPSIQAQRSAGPGARGFWRFRHISGALLQAPCFFFLMWRTFSLERQGVSYSVADRVVLTLCKVNFKLKRGLNSKNYNRKQNAWEHSWESPQLTFPGTELQQWSLRVDLFTGNSFGLRHFPQFLTGISW